MSLCTIWRQRYWLSESIELFIEDHVFSLSYDLAPRPSPPSHVSKFLSLSQSSCASPVKLMRGGGEKAWSSINHSIFSDGYGCLKKYQNYINVRPRRLLRRVREFDFYSPVRQSARLYL